MNWLAFGSMFLYQASAVGYGFTQKVNKKTIAPPFVIVARILKRYRGKSSYLFLIKWAVIKKPRRTYLHILPEISLRQLNMSHEDIRRLTGIYRGLKDEIGHFLAVSASVEIARNLNAWQKRINQRKKKK